MTAIPADKCLDGKVVAQALRQKLADNVRALPKQQPRPQLHVILVGQDPASHIYVSNKKKACEDIGFRAKTHILPATASAQEVEGLIQKLNHDADVHGILLQLPLPPHLDAEKLLTMVDVSKDVDGFHPINIGRLWRGALDEAHVPCTALGIKRLLEYYKIPMAGQHSVVVGQSNIVGRPTSALMLLGQATMTLCHRHSVPLERYTRDADILVVATGKHHLINRKHIKPGVVIIDVGIHRTEKGLAGDVEVADVLPLVSKITPVPGGVGPMTIACLLENTWNAYQRLTTHAAL